MPSIMDFVRMQYQNPIVRAQMGFNPDAVSMQRPQSVSGAMFVPQEEEVMPVELTGGGEEMDWLTELDNARNQGAEMVSVPRRNMPPVVAPVPESAPATGKRMEAESRSSVDDILKSLMSSRDKDREHDKQLAWMSFFSALANNKSPTILGALGEGTDALTRTMREQAPAARATDRDIAVAQISQERWRQEQAMKQAENVSEADLRAATAEYYRSGRGSGGADGVGGATGALINRYMQDMANRGTPITFQKALYDVQTGFRKGTTLDDGEIKPMPGAADAIKTFEIFKEQGALEGKGEVSPKEQREKGQNIVSTATDSIRKTYNALHEAGATVDPSQSAGANLQSYLGNTQVGQLAGRMMGTSEQTLRDNIRNTRPLLINAIRQSTGMGAKAMDSNAELQFYLQMATDPEAGYRANLQALDMIDKLYGTNLSASEAPENKERPPLSSFRK